MSQSSNSVAHKNCYRRKKLCCPCLFFYVCFLTDLTWLHEMRLPLTTAFAPHSEVVDAREERWWKRSYFSTMDRALRAQHPDWLLTAAAGGKIAMSCLLQEMTGRPAYICSASLCMHEVMFPVYVHFNKEIQYIINLGVRSSPHKW